MNTDTKDTCYKKDCNKPLEAKNRCRAHYLRWYKYGDDNHRQRSAKGESLAYFNKMLAVETNDCIEWPYGKVKGYGRFQVGDKMELVHRVALLQKLGQPPDHKPLALHKPLVCHNQSCFNHRHLYWGNQKDNMADKIIDGTTNLGKRIVKQS